LDENAIGTDIEIINEITEILKSEFLNINTNINTSQYDISLNSCDNLMNMIDIIIINKKE
jgi:hypothetical protein